MPGRPAGRSPPAPAWPADSCSSSRSRGPATRLPCRRSPGQGGRRPPGALLTGPPPWLGWGAPPLAAGAAARDATYLGGVAGHTRKYVGGGFLGTSSHGSVDITNSYTGRIFQITKVLLSSKHQSSWWLLTKALAATDDTTNAETLAATAATLYAQ